MKKIFLIGFLFLTSLNPLYAKDYGFGFKRSVNGIRPSIGLEMENLLDKYQSYYIGKDDKSLYLTFDCGYENGYTPKILDVIENKNIKACFFVTGYFIEKNPELIERMINNKNIIIGNHTNKHKNMTKISENEIIRDLKENEEIFNKTTNNNLSNFIRPPEGNFNENSLKITANEGYKNIFWSISYVDWKTNEQKGQNYAFEQLTKQLHNGAIILMHNVSEDNSLVLEDFINYCESQEYIFRGLDELTK